MKDLLGQELKVGDYVASIEVYRGSCDAILHLVTGKTNAKVKILKLRTVIDELKGEPVSEWQQREKEKAKTPTRIVKVSPENAKESLGDVNFQLIEKEVRSEMIG